MSAQVWNDKNHRSVLASLKRLEWLHSEAFRKNGYLKTFEKLSDEIDLLDKTITFFVSTVTNMESRASLQKGTYDSTLVEKYKRSQPKRDMTEAIIFPEENARHFKMLRDRFSWSFNTHDIEAAVATLQWARSEAIRDRTTLIDGMPKKRKKIAIERLTMYQPRC